MKHFQNYLFGNVTVLLVFGDVWRIIIIKRPFTELFPYLKLTKLFRASFVSTDNFSFPWHSQISRFICIQPHDKPMLLFTGLSWQCFHHVALIACLLSYRCGALPVVTNSNTRLLPFPKSLKSTNGMASFWIVPSSTPTGKLSFRCLALIEVCMYTINIKEEANIKMHVAYASRLWFGRRGEVTVSLP